MSYFQRKIDELSRDYGNLTGTYFRRLEQEIYKKDTFALVGEVLSTKTRVEETLSELQSIRNHCEYIDRTSGSTYVIAIDKLRNTLRNKTMNSLNLLSKNALRKDFHSCKILLEEAISDLSAFTETVLDLVNLKECFDLRSLPADYIELFETGEIKYVGKVFLSYCMRDENEVLINGLISPFLEELGFQTVYASRDFPPNKAPGQNAEEFIKKCGTLIAFLTKDQELRPSANVIHEIGVASDKVVILFAEKGAVVPSNLTTSITYYNFDRQNTGDVLLKIIHSLRLLTIYKVPKMNQ
jgi:hypothetical protein